MPDRHAEIAGAGFAGLVAALALAQRGWSVRVHERTPFLRAEGFALTMHGNGVRVLKALGVFEDAVAGAMRVASLETRNADNETTLTLTPPTPPYRVSRQQLIHTLAAAAEARGVEIEVGSAGVSATPEGELELDDGRRLKADLVVAADGVNSALRDRSAIQVRRIPLPAGGAFRVMIPRSAEEKEAEPGDAAINYEFWSGRRRIIANPSSREELYLALSCPADDAAGKALPIDVPSWERAFPHREDLFARIRAGADWDRVQWARFEVLKLRAWSAGRLAVVGDAAHAMAPDLGQGGGTAMVNALALAVALDDVAPIPRALALWESRERPLTEHTQRWARLYNHSTLWPERLRTFVFEQVGAWGFLRRQVQRPSAHIPRGYVEEEAASIK